MSFRGSLKGNRDSVKSNRDSAAASGTNPARSEWSGSTSSGSGVDSSNYKLVMVGDSGVGKSCILEKLLDSASTNTFISTIGVDVKNHTLKDNGRSVKLQIWDTGGQQRYRPVLSTCYRNADGIVVVFDLTNKKSFINLAQWISEIDEFSSNTNRRENTPKLLLGNKSDLDDRREIDAQTAQSFAKDKNMTYLETSAIHATSTIRDGFLTLCRPRLNSASSGTPPETQHSASTSS